MTIRRIPLFPFDNYVFPVKITTYKQKGDAMAKTAGFAFRVNQEITALFKQYGKLKAYEEGKEIVKQGDYSNTVYILLEGEADVIRVDRFGNENTLATLTVGDIVGEMGAFLNNKRSATVRAKTVIKALECPNQMFIRGLFSTHELTYRIIKNFADRINNLNGQVANHSQARLMLVLDRFIQPRLVEGRTVQDIELDMHEITIETRLESNKIVEGLYNFKALNAITKLKFPAEINILEVEVEGQNIGDYEEGEDSTKRVEVQQADSGKVICQIDSSRYSDTIRRISYF
jgi:CRP-like cAMP-binding protein